jgi:hypothetical protein
MVNTYVLMQVSTHYISLSVIGVYAYLQALLSPCTYTVSKIKQMSPKTALDYTEVRYHLCLAFRLILCGHTDQQTISCTNDRALWFTDHSSGICQCVSGIDSISLTDITTTTTDSMSTTGTAATTSTCDDNCSIPLAPPLLPRSPPLSVSASALQPPRPASRRQIALQQHLRRMRALQTYDYVTTARDTLLQRIQQYQQQQHQQQLQLSGSSRCFCVWKAFDLLRRHRCPLITKGVTANHVELLVLTALDIQAKVSVATTLC